jgi:hypothetical protein
VHGARAKSLTECAARGVLDVRQSMDDDMLSKEHALEYFNEMARARQRHHEEGGVGFP